MINKVATARNSIKNHLMSSGSGRSSPPGMRSRKPSDEVVLQAYPYSNTLSVDLLLKWAPDVAAIAKQVMADTDLASHGSHVYHRHLQELIANGDGVDQQGDLDASTIHALQQLTQQQQQQEAASDVGQVEIEPIVRRYHSTMYNSDVVISNDIGRITLEKMDQLRRWVGDDLYRQLNI